MTTITSVSVSITTATSMIVTGATTTIITTGTTATTTIATTGTTVTTTIATTGTTVTTTIVTTGITATGTSTTTTTRVCINGNTAITFDDLASSIAVPSGYNNIIWTNAYTYTTSANTSGYYTGIASPPNTMYNAYGNPVTMATANSSLFTLYSLAVAAAWYDNLQLTVDGYNSNVLIVTNTFTLQVFSLSYLTFSGYSGLDTVIFTSSGGTQDPNVAYAGTQFAMDNICLTFT